MKVQLDEKDIAILTLMQRNCKLSARELAKEIGSPITTVFAKIKRMEKMGIILGYKAILNSTSLNFGTTAYILASVSYGAKNTQIFSQRDIAESISKFPEVQAVHIITGNWDLIIKIKADTVDNIGKFVIDQLRLVNGIEKTLTCMVFETCKETSDIPLTSTLLLHKKLRKIPR